MVAHAREEAPLECCGILAGEGGEVRKLYRTTNVERSPVRYNVDPRELLRICREVEERGWEILGIYHSHTHTEAYPSATDINLAFWPDSVYLIISLRRPEAPEVRAFHIREGTVAEVKLEVV